MNRYLRTTLALAISTVSLMSYADYKVNYFLDNNNISFTTKPAIPEAEWLLADPALSEWSYVGDYFNCKSALPTVETQPTGAQFTQTLSECTRIRTRTIQAREQNNQTQEYRNIGSSVDETENEEHLTYTKQLTGSNVSFDINFGAGRYTSTTGDTIVGLYARTNAGIAIGSTVLNENGARILLYYTSPAYYTSLKSCTLRFGITSKTGWTPGGITPPTALNDLKKYNYIDLYSSSNVLYKRYSISGSAVNTSDTGFFKDLSVPCAEMLSFYNNTSFFSKAVLSKN